jgi:hypothetical protein
VNYFFIFDGIMKNKLEKLFKVEDDEIKKKYNFINYFK